MSFILDQLTPSLDDPVLLKKACRSLGFGYGEFKRRAEAFPAGTPMTVIVRKIFKAHASRFIAFYTRHAARAIGGAKVTISRPRRQADGGYTIEIGFKE